MVVYISVCVPPILSPAHSYVFKLSPSDIHHKSKYQVRLDTLSDPTIPAGVKCRLHI